MMRGQDLVRHDALLAEFARANRKYEEENEKPSPAATRAPDRFHAFDALRAFMLLAGIVQHASMSFFFPVGVQDNSPSSTLSVTFYVIHTFRMAVFFLIAGFFARMVLQRRGKSAFVKDRSKRILVPMVGGWFVFALPAIMVSHWAYASSWSFSFQHLWFLYYLIIFYVLALILREVFNGLIDRSARIRVAIDTAIRGLSYTWFLPLTLAAPLSVLLYRSEVWEPWWGLPAPQGFRPQLIALVGYGTAFAFGWFVHRQMELLARWQGAWRVNIGIGVVLTAVCLSLIGITPTSTLSWGRMAYVGCYTSAIWFWTFGILGAGLYFFSQESPVRRYLADSSYWAYLAHWPIVILLQVMLAEVPLHWTVKFPMMLAITSTVLLVSYHYWVRPTFVGAILNGRIYPGPEWRGERLGTMGS